MKRVRWTDNVCTVGGTCVHGFFTKSDLKLLFGLCPGATFTPTFFHEKLGPSGFNQSDLGLLDLPFYGKPIGDKELGYYFTFMEREGAALLEYLRNLFPLQRGEGCH